MSEDLLDEGNKIKRPSPLHLKSENHEYSKHLLSVLARNNLKIYNEQKKNGLFEALSEGLFLKPTRGETLKDLCKKYVSINSLNKTFPVPLAFLHDLPSFSMNYCQYITTPCFEPVTLQIISCLFEMSVVLHSIFDKNNVLFSSTFNNNYSRKSQFVAFPVCGEVSYGAVFEVNQGTRFNSAVDKELQIQEAPLLRRATGNVNAEEEVLQNETILEKKMKELEESFSLLEKSSLSLVLETADSDTFQPSNYSRVIGPNLNSVAQIEVSLQKLKDNEVNVTSVQKQLQSVLQLYTHSVCKSDLSDKKFHFTDEFNVSGMDREVKAQIVFGDRSNHLVVNSVPPGIMAVNEGLNKFKFTAEKTPQAKLSATPDFSQCADFIESAKKKKDIEVIEYNKDQKFKGKVKFYNEDKRYGFITVQEPGVEPHDVFVYDDALREAQLTIQELKEVKGRGRKILVNFCKYIYVATNKKPSTKAVDIEVVSNSL